MALDYLAAQLEALGLTGYRLVDVRNQAQCLSFQVANTYKGTADAILVPSEVSNVACALQARVIFDWKLPTANAIEVVRGQALAELIGGIVHSYHPVMVVFTDLVSKSHVFKLGESVVGQYINLSMDQMLTMVMDHMETTTKSQKPAPKYKANEDVKRIKETALPLETMLKNMLELMEGNSPMERALEFASILRDRQQPVPYLSYIS